MDGGWLGAPGGGKGEGRTGDGSYLSRGLVCLSPHKAAAEVGLLDGW